MQSARLSAANSGCRLLAAADPLAELSDAILLKADLTKATLTNAVLFVSPILYDATFAKANLTAWLTCSAAPTSSLPARPSRTPA